MLKIKTQRVPHLGAAPYPFREHGFPEGITFNDNIPKCMVWTFDYYCCSGIALQNLSLLLSLSLDFKKEYIIQICKCILIVKNKAKQKQNQKTFQESFQGNQGDILDTKFLLPVTINSQKANSCITLLSKLMFLYFKH